MPEASPNELRAELAHVVSLLSKGNVSQNELARRAGYSRGYVSQLLSSKYPAHKLSQAAVASLVTSAYSASRDARLSADDARDLRAALDDLSSRYGASQALVFGMDGEFLDREAANYIIADVDKRLNEDIDNHVNYGVVQVTGAPGQGKTWALARLALRAEFTHEVCWVDFERFQRDDSLATKPHLLLGSELRAAQQRYFRTLERLLRQRSPEGANQPLGQWIEEALSTVSTARVRPRIDAMRNAVDRLIEERLPGLRRAGPFDDDDGSSGVLPSKRYLDLQKAVWYDAIELADDFCLLAALIDAVALLESGDSRDAIGPDPRRVLVLVDGPDRAADGNLLMQLLREIATLEKRHIPEITRTLVVVAKTTSSKRGGASGSSFLRRWYQVSGFSPEEAGRLISVLREHGWFRGAEVASDADLLERCERLSGLNRRVTSLYLDYVQGAQELVDLESYLSAMTTGDRRATGWQLRWAQRVLLDLSRLDHQDDARLSVDVMEWCTKVAERPHAELADDLGDCSPDNEELRAYCDRLGLIVNDKLPLFQYGVISHLVALSASAAEPPVSA